MGFLSQLSTVSTASRLRAERGGDPFAGLYNGYMPTTWVNSLSTAGIRVTPDLAMTLSAMYSGVTMIGYDLSSCPLQVFRELEDGGKDRVKPVATKGGIGGFAYRLRYLPNDQQTSTEFFLSMIAQWLLRSVAYAEITKPTGADQVGQLLPRHPDRVRTERLPSGKLRFQLREADGTERPVTQDEMFVCRDLSFDGGLSTVSRVAYGTESLGSALATGRAAAKFFKSGMTAAMLATYTDNGQGEDNEGDLHKSISRFAAGVENSFGLLLVPDDVKISNLSPEPEKAQMMLAQEWGVREVARLLRLPPHKLGITGAVTYASQVQSALEYIISTLRPVAVVFEQAMKRDLIVQKDFYNAEFKLEALMRGDFESQSKYLEKFIRNRIMRPSEARVILNMNPDEELDRLSARDFQPGIARGGNQGGGSTDANARMAGHSIREVLTTHDNAMRCLKRERERVEQLAKKHASDVPGWKASLQDFMSDQAGFVAKTLRLPMSIAREVCAQHGTEIEAAGVVVMTEAWERETAEDLTALSLEYERRAA